MLKYCKECNSRDTWERNPAGDIKLANGSIYEYSYICQNCGHTTILPYWIKELEVG